MRVESLLAWMADVDDSTWPRGDGQRNPLREFRPWDHAGACCTSLPGVRQVTGRPGGSAPPVGEAALLRQPGSRRCTAAIRSPFAPVWQTFCRLAKAVL